MPGAPPERQEHNLCIICQYMGRQSVNAGGVAHYGAAIMRQQAARRDPPAVAELSGIEPLGALSKLTRLARVFILLSAAHPPGPNHSEQPSEIARQLSRVAATP